MLLAKTQKGVDELANSGKRALTPRERAMLVLVDGTREAQTLGAVYNGEGLTILQKLLRDGYIQRPVNGTAAAAPAGSVSVPAARKAPPAAAMPAPANAALKPPPKAPAPTPAALSAPAPAPVTNADSFEGKRSLATTRMFLLDIVERTFSRRAPEIGTKLRDVLRDARDRASLVEAGREVVEQVEFFAGAERADSISERIAMLLPPE